MKDPAKICKVDGNKQGKSIYCTIIVVGKHDINTYVCYNHALSSSTRCIWNTMHPTLIQFGFMHCYAHLCIMKETQFPDTHTRCAHCHVFKLRHSYSSSSQIESIDVYMQLHTLSHSKREQLSALHFHMHSKLNSWCYMLQFHFFACLHNNNMNNN